ncbi:MAG: hypothetical protein K6L73_11590 [Cellvibrionaceae bacterium]
MRALAEYIMRGRVQATIVVLLGSLLPLISPATVALVSLRRGPLDGIPLLLWACLPQVVAVWAGVMEPLLCYLYTGSMAVVLITALVLRQTISWMITLLTIVLVSAVTAQLIQLFAADLIAALLAEVQTVVDKVRSEAKLEPQALEPSYIVAMFAYFMAVMGVLALLLGRWWQALLYNPSGFGSEFRDLKLPMPAAAGLLLVLVGMITQENSTVGWVGLLSLPLLLVGIAIWHQVVDTLGLGTPWLVLFYMGLIFVKPFSLLVILMAGLDSWFDFRGMVARKKGEPRE